MTEDKLLRLNNVKNCLFSQQNCVFVLKTSFSSFMPVNDFHFLKRMSFPSATSFDLYSIFENYTLVMTHVAGCSELWLIVHLSSLPYWVLKVYAVLCTSVI